jgi:hypothetical protein
VLGKGGGSSRKLCNEELNNCIHQNDLGRAFRIYMYVCVCVCVCVGGGGLREIYIHSVECKQCTEENTWKTYTLTERGTL